MDPETIEKAKKIKAVAFDLDGVIFTGRVMVNPDGVRLQERSRVDGLGVSLLRGAGLRIAFISSGSTAFLKMLEKQQNNMPSSKSGDWAPVVALGGKKAQAKDKVTLGEGWLKEIGISWEECAYMGDDLSDYYIMQKAGLAGAPAQAEEVIKDIAHYVAPREGGNGAVRDFANLILNAQGVDITTLALK